MPGVELNAECLPVPIRVLERRRHQILLGVHAPIVAQRERPVPRCVPDRPPEVDDLVAAREQLGYVFGRQVTPDARGGGFGGLVDVDLQDRLVLLRVVLWVVLAATADRWGGAV